LSWAIFLGAFVGALIELVEVLAVVLVVGRVAGWRNALAGAGSAVGLVAVAALVVGSGLALIPARPLELLAGLILLGFGQAWARSVTKYYGGVPGAPDDDDERLRERLARDGGRVGWDTVALATAFKSSLVESFEIAIVVIGLGTAGGNWFEAIGGTLVATGSSSALRSSSSLRWRECLSDRPSSSRRLCSWASVPTGSVRDWASGGPAECFP
jgi:uncharacterized membrane protein